MDTLLSEAGDAAVELVRLLPFLPEALSADAGTGDGQPSAPVKDVHRSLVNGDVLHSISYVQREVPAIDAQARRVLGETPHGGDVLDILRPMPALIVRVDLAGFDDLAREYAYRLLRVHRSVRSSLHLTTPDIPLGYEHPGCGGQLVLPGRHAEAHVRITGDGRVQLDRGQREAITWGLATGIECRQCGASWHPSQARALAEWLNAA
jgi:hypothetical protein